MFKFEVGKSYEPNDPGFDPVTVVKRTEKMIQIKNDRGTTWRMRIRVDEDGNEYVADSSVPKGWRHMLTYQAKYIAE